MARVCVGDKIEIRKGAGWYSDRINEEFTVNEVSTIDGDVIYFVDPDGDNRRFIQRRDCVITTTTQGNPSDAVSHPSHYTAGEIEVIDIIAQTVAGYDDPFVGHCVGTATKYLNRAPFKNNLLEDLKKSRAYVNFAIKHMEKDADE